jgi:trans-L-3-hydroxyproline dehydratase
VSLLIRTIDAHAGGHPVRVIVAGAPSLRGSTLRERVASLRRSADDIRRALVLPPRGHQDLLLAQLIEPSERADAAVVFMDHRGYRALSGHGLMAVTTIALERGLVQPGAPPDAAAASSEGFRGLERALSFETLAGPVLARARMSEGTTPRVETVSVRLPPAFVHTPGHVVRVGTRALRVDVAFGGAYYAIADTEAVGIPLLPERAPELRRLAIDVTRMVNGSVKVGHPSMPRAQVAGVVFTGPAEDPAAHLRAVCVSGTGGITWSPGATAMAAVMSVLDAMALLPDSTPFVQEGLSGAAFRGAAVRRVRIGDFAALICDVEGDAWVTGEHAFLRQPDDPFRDGLPLDG